MRLALIESDDERRNLAALVRRNPKLFQNKVFVDGINLNVTTEYDYDDEIREPQPCYSVQKKAKSKLEFRSEKCNGATNKFLCEQVEVVDSYIEPHQSDRAVDVKATFFTYIGNFGETFSFKTFF